MITMKIIILLEVKVWIVYKTYNLEIKKVKKI